MYCSLFSTEFVSRRGGLNPGLELVVRGMRVVVKYRDLLRDWRTLHLVRFEGRGLAMCFPDEAGSIAQGYSITVTVTIVSFENVWS